MLKAGKENRHLWNLVQDIIYLNNGSFGATPIEVLNDSFYWSKKAEEEPMHFFVDNYFNLIREIAVEIARFLGAEGKDLVFLDNATTGVNTVLNSLSSIGFSDGEIVTTNHVYPAVRNAMQFYSQRFNLTYREIEIPFPSLGKDEILENIKNGLNHQTRLLVIDHITSATALVFPVKEIAELCRQMGILMLIDGAHVPGMFNLDIPSIGCDFYTGNLHKWLFAPKGSAILWVKPELQDKIHPLTMSLFMNQGFTHEFDWTGTKSPSSYLASKCGLEFFQKFGEEEIYDYRRNLIRYATHYLASELDLAIPTPEIGDCAMTSFFVPRRKIKDQFDIRRTLLDKYKIELFTSEFEGNLLFRISTQIYNFEEEYVALANALKEII